jgi:hypothetical protein
MQRHTDVFDANGHLILCTVGIDIDMWNELYETWDTAIVFERVTRENTTARLEWHDLVAIAERGKPIRYFR